MTREKAINLIGADESDSIAQLWESFRRKSAEVTALRDKYPPRTPNYKRFDKRLKALSEVSEFLEQCETEEATAGAMAKVAILLNKLDNIVEKTGRSVDEARKILASNNPQGRFIQPEEVAATAMWLISDAAASVTGQAISISGGET